MNLDECLKEAEEEFDRTPISELFKSRFDLSLPELPPEIKEALELADLTLDKNDPEKIEEVRRKESNCYIKGDLLNAVLCFEKLSKAAADNADDHRWLGETFSEKAKKAAGEEKIKYHKKAVSSFEKAVEKRGNYKDYHDAGQAAFELSELQKDSERSRSLKKTASYLEKALELQEVLEDHCRLGLAYFYLGTLGYMHSEKISALQKAIPHLEILANDGKGIAANLLNSAKSALEEELKQKKKDEEAAKKRITLSKTPAPPPRPVPKTYEEYIKQGKICFDKGEYVKALAWFSKITSTESNGKIIEKIYWEGRSFLEWGKTLDEKDETALAFASAVVMLESTAKLRGDKDDYYYLGLARSVLGDEKEGSEQKELYEKAYEDFRTALSKGEDDYQTRLRIEEVKTKISKTKAEIEKTATDESSSEIEKIRKQGKKYFKNKDYRNAVNCFEKTVKTADADDYYRFGRSLLEHGKKQTTDKVLLFARAVEYLKKAYSEKKYKKYEADLSDAKQCLDDGVDKEYPATKGVDAIKNEWDKICPSMGYACSAGIAFSAGQEAKDFTKKDVETFCIRLSEFYKDINSDLYFEALPDYVHGLTESLAADGKPFFINLSLIRSLSDTEIHNKIAEKLEAKFKESEQYKKYMEIKTDAIAHFCHSMLYDTTAPADIEVMLENLIKLQRYIKENGMEYYVEKEFDQVMDSIKKREQADLSAIENFTDAYKNGQTGLSEEEAEKRIDFYEQVVKRWRIFKSAARN